MRIHPALSLVPAAGAVGAAVMSYNASIDIAKDQGFKNASQYSINTSELNFMGMQDAFIAGSLLIGFAAIARGVYLYSQQQKGDARNYFKLGGSMLMAAGLYALTAGFFDLSMPSSKIGGFNNNANSAIFGTVYSALTLIGAALLGTGFKMTKNNAKPAHLGSDGAPQASDRDSHVIGSATITAASDPDVAAAAGVPHVAQVYGTVSSSSSSSSSIDSGSTSASDSSSTLSWVWSKVSSISNPFSSKNQPGQK